MSYKGRVITFLSVFITNTIYVSYYYFRDGHLSLIELIGFPILLVLAWWFGKQYDLSQYFSKKYRQKQKELEESYRALEQNRNELYSLFENNNAFIWSIDLLKKEVTVSKGIENLSGFTQKEFKDDFSLWISRVIPEDRERVESYYTELLAGTPAKCQWRIFTHHGDMLWVEGFGNPIIDSIGAIVKITGVASDITERKQAEELIKQMAYHDQLTGLPNRYLLNDYLQKYLSFSKRNNNSLAVMFLDIDNFKMVNDHKGHDIGDALLKEVASRLVNSIREGDVAARLGGDEFIILLKDADESDAAEVAERVISTFNKPILIKEDAYSISTSIGISMYPNDAQDGELLIQLADAAMYCTKRQGKNKHRFYAQTQYKCCGGLASSEFLASCNCYR